MFASFETRILEHPGPQEQGRIRSLLEAEGLVFEGSPEVTILLESPEGCPLATGSLEGHVLRMIAVDPQRREEGLAAAVVSRLVEEGRRRGQTHLFVFTKPMAAERFTAFGFIEIAHYDPHVVLLEMGEPGLASFRRRLREYAKGLGNGATRGSIVMNANPFTQGHRYLVEEGAQRCDHLFVIVVEAERSTFPFTTRLRLVQEGTADLKNVTVLGGGDYAVSPATFPTYFLKHLDNTDQIKIQSRLDATLFATTFGPDLGLCCRFVGTEPRCPVTALYNEALQEILPGQGISVTVIPRRRLDRGDVISASTVRQLWADENWTALRSFVPDATFAFLQDPSARPLWEQLRRESRRH